jgi:hypothetical protein
VSWKTPNEAPQEARKAAAPRRREKRLDHLNPHIVPVERALLARAEALDKELEGYEGSEWTPLADAYMAMRDEFRALAEELHWQP